MKTEFAPNTLAALIDGARDMITANPIEALMTFTIVLAMVTAKAATANRGV
jgi:hypothetical protein